MNISTAIFIVLNRESVKAFRFTDSVMGKEVISLMKKSTLSSNLILAQKKLPFQTNRAGDLYIAYAPLA